MPELAPTTPGVFPIVGIGASAGGLEAFTQLLQALPADTGMAFVLVQHLDPRPDSRLVDLLAKATPIDRISSLADLSELAPEKRTPRGLLC